MGMLVLRYFGFVGGALVALLLVCAAVLPNPSVSDDVAASRDVPMIRIHSERKLPERVVFDTNAPMPAPPQVTGPAIRPQQPLPAEAAAKAREAFAQMHVAGDSKLIISEIKKPESKSVVKRRVAHARLTPEPYYREPYYSSYGYQRYGYSQYAPSSRMMVAQQPRFGFFW
jgi:hypothetical protein